MSTYVLVPGAGGSAWYWHRVIPLLEERGHEVIAVQLPAADESAGLEAYTQTVVKAAEGRDDVILVAQSMGGFTAPLVADRRPVRELIMVNAMIPAPGETAGNWWSAVGQEDARRRNDIADGRDPGGDFDLETYFFHDVPAEVTAESMKQDAEDEAAAAFEDPWPLKAWPDVPTRVITGRDDRLFPLDLQTRVAQDRLGVTAEVVPGGHLVALSYPHELVDQILR